MHRRFGVEVEFGGDTGSAINALLEAGLSNMRHRAGYVGHDDSNWLVKLDGSVYEGGELVSPPLWFDEQRDQVNRAIDALRTVGCRPIVSAGIHVHVDAGDLTPQQVVAVARSFYKFEDVIYRLASSGWRELREGARSYAWPLREERMRAMMRCTTIDQLMQVWYETNEDYAERCSRDHGHGSRYCGINLHSYFYRRTIEFRIFNSSMNPDRIQAYIALCMGLVADALKGSRRSINRRYRYGGMADGTTNAQNAFHRLLQVLRYDAGMSLEDMKLITKAWKDSVPQSGVFVPAQVR